MPAPVVIDFQVGGIADVRKAFRSVEEMLAKTEKAVDQSSQRQGTTQVGTAQQTSRKLAGISERRYRELERWADKQAKAEERAAKKGQEAVERANRVMARAAQKAAADMTAAKEKEAARRLQLELKSAAMTARLIDRQIRDEKRRADASVREAERAEARREVLADRRLSKLSQTLAREEALARSSAERQAAAQTRARERFARATGQAAGVVGGAVSRGVNTATNLVGTALAVGGGFGVADSIGTDIRNRGRAADVAIQSGGETTSAEILNKANAVGIQYSTSSEKVLDGLDRFVAKSGNVKSGFDAIGQLVELATATGSDLGELSETAGVVQNATGDSKKTLEVMRTFAGQGRKGSVDMRELAQYASRITGGSVDFADKAGAIKLLGAFTQEAAARGGASSAAVATESVEKYGEDILKHNDRFKARGINVFAKDGKTLADPAQILKDTLSATGGGKADLLHLFGERSQHAVTSYASVYRDAFANTKGTKKEKDAAGRAAVDKQIALFADVTLSESQVREESGKRLAEVDKQVEKAMQELRVAVGTELTPELTKLIPRIRELVPLFSDGARKLGEFIGWFAANPVKGIGAIVLASITKELATAGIGAAVKATLTALLTTMGGGGGGGPLPGGAGGKVAGALAGAAIGVGVGIAAVEYDSAKKDAASRVLARDLGATATTRGLTKEQLVEQKAAIERELGETQRKRNQTATFASDTVVGSASYLLGRVQDVATGGTDTKDAYASNLRALDISIKTLKDNLEASAKALAEATGGGSNASFPPAAADPAHPARLFSMGKPIRGGTE